MWTEELENPKALEMFMPEPSLEGIIMNSISLERNGPTVTMSIQAREYPANPPAKWRLQEHNAVTIELQAMGVELFEIHGWTTENLVSIWIDRLPSRKLDIRASGAATDVKLRCGWLRIVGVTPYHRES